VGLILIVILIFGALYMLFMVPQRRRVRDHAAMQDSLGAGDEVITAGGLHGTVREVEDGTVRVEVAPSVVVTVDRRAIAAVARDVEVEVEGETAPEAPPEPPSEAS
jgi:preprotein translocase subunit YajC